MNPASRRIAATLAGLVLLAPAAMGATDASHIRNLERDLAPSATAPGVAAVSLLARMQALHVPGVSIAYIHEGRIAWKRGYGVTRAGGPHVTPDTLFQAGSISKAVTTMGVLKLVEAGVLDLDTDVRSYLKRWQIPDNNFSHGHAITLRQLLSHTAGMPVHGFDGYASDADVPSIIQVLNGEQPANSPAIVPQAAPGTGFQYSGGGYVVAQTALEDATGMDFAQMMQQNVFAPLGMTDSTFQQSLPPQLARLAATPYRPWEAQVRGGAHRFAEMAPAGLWTTPSDLARFVIALQRSLAGHPGKGLSTQMAHQMVTAVTPPEKLGITWGGAPNGYGLGLVVAGGAHPFFWHDGEVDGFLSLMVAYDKGDGVVVMTNGDNGDDLTGDILRTIAREYDWPNFAPVTPNGPTNSSLDGYAGHYRTKGGRIYTVTREDGALFERHIGVGKTRMLPAGDHAFVVSRLAGRDETARLAFTMDAQASAASITVHEGTDASTATRVADSDPAVIWSDALMTRIDTQGQGEGTEAALRGLIAQLARGEPDYAGMEDSGANQIRPNQAFYQKDAGRLGALRALIFRGVGPGGNDYYEAEYAHGWAFWRIGLSRAGKIRMAYYLAE